MGRDIWEGVEEGKGRNVIKFTISKIKTTFGKKKLPF